jgi:hypothetical protein
MIYVIDLLFPVSDTCIRFLFGPRIRIATRSSNCSRGIGFRCGLIKVNSQQVLLSERDKLVKIDIDEESKIMNLEFLEPVDWEKLRGE